MTINATQLSAVVVSGPASPEVVATRVDMVVQATQPAPRSMFTQVFATILATRTPIYRFINVILPDVFPNDISYNSVGSIRFATDVILVDSGADQRIGRWDQPLMEFDIAYGVRTMEQLSALIGFFRAMRGRLYAFNYRDHLDYTSSVATAFEARAAPAISRLDQALGLGDNSTYQFQLTKTYATGSGQSLVRPITRPEAGTVIMGVGGVQATNFTVNTDSGIVTFTPPLSVSLGHTVTKDAVGASINGVSVIVGTAGDFTPLSPFVGRRVTLQGWAVAGSNIGLSVVANIFGVSGDGSQLMIGYPPGYGAVADTAAALTVSLHPAPVASAAITAGFQFFVPCRFDTDTLPVTLDDYGVGSSQSIKVVEVRSYSF